MRRVAPYRLRWESDRPIRLMQSEKTPASPGFSCFSTDPARSVGNPDTSGYHPDCLFCEHYEACVDLLLPDVPY